MILGEERLSSQNPLCLATKQKAASEENGNGDGAVFADASTGVLVGVWNLLLFGMPLVADSTFDT